METNRSDNYWKRHRVRRRQLLRGAAVAGVGGATLALVGCGDDDDDAPRPTATQPSGNGGQTPQPTEGPGGDITGFEWIQNEPDLTATPKTGGDLKYGTYIRAASLDPIRSASFESANIYTPVYGRLFRGTFGTEMASYNPWSFSVENDMAASYESQGTSSYTITLKDGLTWHDKDPVNGRPFTAEDVKFTLESFTASAEFNAFLPIDSVEAVNDTTVTVTLSEPINYFIEALTENRIVMLPREVADEDGDFATRAIGTGAFQLDEYVPATRAKYSRFPNFHQQGRPYLDSIEFEAVPDAATARSAFISGNYLLMRGEGVGELDTLDSVMSQRQDATVLRFQSRWQSNVFHVGFQVDGTAFADPRVRKAVSKSFDRETYGDTAIKGGSYNILGPYAWVDWYDAEPDLGDAYVYDLDAARQLLSDAGVSDLTVPIEYFPYSQALEDQLVFWKEQASEAGINLDLQRLEFADFSAKYFTGNFSGAALGFVATFPRYAPISAKLLWHSASAKNYYGINDDVIDSGLATLTTTTNTDEKREAFQTVMNQLLHEAYILQMVEGPTHFVHSNQIHGFLPNMYHDWGGWGYAAMQELWMDA